MIALGLAGAGLMMYSAIGMVRNTTRAQIRRHLNKYLDANKLEGVHVRKISRRDCVYTAKIVLTYDVTLEDFKKHLPGIEQAVAAPVKFRHIFGATCELDVGYAPFNANMSYVDPPSRKLAIPLYSPFGLQCIDFSDDASCHLLIGGATRMGKSILLRLIATRVMTATRGKCRILFADNKITDLYMFRNIPQITLAETLEDARKFVSETLEEVSDRKELLKAKKDVVDVKELRKKYPDITMEPIFIIIDEYGRFADDKVFQELVTMLAETAGYLDVHLIVASQRPDAKDVLKPRIKANMITRLSFKTSDETNSNIILDLPDAAHLPTIKGRAVLLDGFTEVVQVPFISPEEVIKLLEPYRKVEVEEDVSEAGSDDTEIPETLPSFVTAPIGEADLPGSGEAEQYSEPDYEAPSPRRVRARRSPRTR